MPKTIWKYELKLTDLKKIIMPIGAKILTVQCQHEKPCMWVLVDPGKEMEIREVGVFGTGYLIPDGFLEYADYIGTYQQANGALVFHVFVK